MIYLFCHGDTTKLRFEKNRNPMEPNSISRAPNPNWPIVFLNACYAGDINPLALGTFRDKFREKKAAFVVGPSFPIRDGQNRR
jgi:hypothetical protein